MLNHGTAVFDWNVKQGITKNVGPTGILFTDKKDEGIYTQHILDANSAISLRVPGTGPAEQQAPWVAENIRLCDEILAALFGGEGAVAETLYKRDSKTGAYDSVLKNRLKDAGHDITQGTAFHIYAPDGISRDIGAFIPSGYTRVSGGKYKSGEGPKDVPDRRYNFFEFVYEKGYGAYKKPFTINVVHLKDVDLDGALDIDPSVTNTAGSVRIGNIGGPGGMSWKTHTY
jgi:hypothetical protein